MKKKTHLGQDLMKLAGILFRVEIVKQTVLLSLRLRGSRVLFPKLMIKMSQGINKSISKAIEARDIINLLINNGK
jgi:hypothetical protein